MNLLIPATTLLLLLVAIPAHADGGGPILLIFSVYLFCVGQVWIVFSECVYLKLLHRSESLWSILKTVIIMNVASTLLGGLALPLMFALVGLIGASMMEIENLVVVGEYIFAAGTWVAGDNSPHATLAMFSTGVGFLGTYFITVYVEKWCLVQREKKNVLPVTSLCHCYCVNLVSYSGLVLLAYRSW